MVLPVLAIGSTIFSGLNGQPQLLIWPHEFESALYFYATISLVMYVFKDNVVTLDELYAGAATFTLLVWGLSMAYSVCQQLNPGSILAVAHSEAPRTWIELMFMSFSIQSGTGVGDVTPVSGPARAIGSLQIFCGVMYITIVISRLVGLAASVKK